MERDIWPAQNGGVSHTERLLMRGSIVFFTSAGLILGLSRFVAVLRADLQNPPFSLGAMIFLAVILAGATLLIVLASAAIGFLIGVLLELVYGVVAERRLVRPVI